MELPEDLNDQLEKTFPEQGMGTIARAIFGLAADATTQSYLSGIGSSLRGFLTALKGDDPSAAEQALVALYVCLHRAGSTYSASERKVLATGNGYSCHPGGLSPLIMAKSFIRPDSVVADLGAGNGLQGLLLQRIRPHRRTLQIELSAEMIRVGQIFQRALGISADRVEWINDDIRNVDLERADFIYIYRPVKPFDGGCDIYRTIAYRLSVIRKQLTILSVADCLAEFLDDSFSLSYTDGHLTCFTKVSQRIVQGKGPFLPT
ncbi:MAG TPA: hypothetical protein VFG09_07840 [Thermodesulfovibrionales bacterium]|jgi:hypothetical protein|nr:hypothetical protein [Thermodesulfovibrionales bacterium]